MSAPVKRHVCGFCGGAYAPTKSGMVRGHWIWTEGPGGFGQYRCPGRGKAPIATEEDR